MLKDEFEAALGHELSVEDYEIIETVYMHYPDDEGICNAWSKETTAALYRTGGRVLFHDLLPRAKARQKLGAQMRELELALSKSGEPDFMVGAKGGP